MHTTPASTEPTPQTLMVPGGVVMWHWGWESTLQELAPGNLAGGYTTVLQGALPVSARCYPSGSPHLGEHRLFGMVHSCTPNHKEIILQTDLTILSLPTMSK